MVPVLVSRRVGLGHHAAAGTSLVAILPIAVVGAAVYHAAGSVDWVAFAGVGSGSVVGAALGARLGNRVRDDDLRRGFAVVCLLVAARLAVPAGLPAGSSAVSADPLHLVGLVVLGGLAGGLSGLLGVGGGILIVPALVLAFGLTQQVAEGTSLAIIVPTGVSGALSHLRLGSARLGPGLLLGGVGACGAAAGAGVASHLPDLPLRLGFAALLSLVGLRMLRSRPAPPEPAGNSVP